jgi:AcrR family transcriptional regulator
MTNKASRKKARLVKTVFKMLSEGGDSKLTSREIARRARVSLPAINYYFGSKANLIRQAEQVYIDEVRKSTGMVIPPGKDPRKALFEHCIKSTAFSSANPGVQRRIFINFLCDKDITPEIIEMNKENAIQVKKMIGKLVKDKDKIVRIKSAIFGAALVNFQLFKESQSYVGAIDLKDPKFEKEFYRVLIDCLAQPYRKP